MFVTHYKNLLLVLLSICALSLLLVLPGCCDDKSVYDYDTYDSYSDDDDTEDAETSDFISTTRDIENDCVFGAVVDGRGTAMLQTAIVSAPGSVVPSAVTLSKDGGTVATSGLIGSAIGEPGWTARFTVDSLDGSPNGPIGTETDFDGTWTITLTVNAPKTCEDIKEPLTLELLAEE